VSSRWALAARRPPRRKRDAVSLPEPPAAGVRARYVSAIPGRPCGASNARGSTVHRSQSPAIEAPVRRAGTGIAPEPVRVLETFFESTDSRCGKMQHRREAVHEGSGQEGGGGCL